VEDVSDATALIALQGPDAEAFLQAFTPVPLGSIPYYHFTSGSVNGVDCVISRTGYTGEDGFELYLDPAGAPELWQTLADRGRERGLKFVGLGARDTLRLEAGYMLYGNDIDETTNPLEAGLGWTVKLDEHEFVGRHALARQKAEGLKRRMVAIEMQDRAIPRPHYPIAREETVIGELTSGTFSPTFERGIALGYVASGQAGRPLGPGTNIEIEIRNARHPARIVRKPIYRRERGQG
jgi:aminomethyltransferase